MKGRPFPHAQTDKTPAGLDHPVRRLTEGSGEDPRSLTEYVFFGPKEATSEPGTKTQELVR